MIPLALALPWFLLGIPVLAGVLFVLHRLRIRHRRMEVVTTLFWQEAIEEARARVFVQRFRHPLVYAFLLFLSLLLWAGFADPKLGSDPEEQSLILVEGSARHMGAERTAEALAAVQDLLSDMPLEGRSVVWCGETERTLLASGEPAALLEARWEGVVPQACPSPIVGIVDRMGELQANTPADRRLPLHVILVGHSTLPKILVEGLPGDMRVQTLALTSAEDSSEIVRSTRLVSLGVAPAESGAWDRVDVLLRLRNPADAVPQNPRLILGDQPLAITPVRSREAGVDRYFYASLPAKGQLLRVFNELQSIGLQAIDLNAMVLNGGGGDEALGVLALPDRQILEVQLEAGLPAELNAVLQADPGLRIVDSDPDVLIGTQPGKSLGARLWLNPKSNEAVFRFTQDAGSKGETRLRRRFGAIGLGGIDARDARAAAEEGAPSRTATEPVRMEFVAGEGRAIEMPLQLLGDGYNFVQSRAFPLFFAEAVRWLASAEEAPRRVAAGEILQGEHSSWKDQAGRNLDPVGAAFFVPAAGEYQGQEGAVLAASLQSPMDDSEAYALSPLQLSSSSGSALLFWITLLALLGLVAEWFLVRTGRMP